MTKILFKIAGSTPKCHGSGTLLGIILRVLRLEFFVWILNHREEDVVFYQVFLLSLLQCTVQ